MKPKPKNTPIRYAAYLCGGISALAYELGVTPEAVRRWIASDRVPPRRVIQIERATGGQVTRYQLCPDIYPD